MTDAYTPPLGSGATEDYDREVRRWTREARWRSAMLEQLSPKAGETIADVGCGTGSFAVLLKTRFPEVQVIGVDPDEQALAIATAKAAAAGVEIDFHNGFADALPEGAADAVVSSLVLHQVPLAGKQKALAGMFRALRPAGRLLLADYLRQEGLMRLLFRMTIQRLDGVHDTQPNADGVVPTLIAQAGFSDVREIWSILTITGRIGLMAAGKPATA